MSVSSPAWKRLLANLASLKLTVVGLLILTALTVWGTLYQADYGLLRAQQRFYQSWVFLAGGWFPFPGAQLVMIVLFINLVSALCYLAVLRKLYWGLLLTHLGLVLMLAAGAVTFYYGSESHLTLEENGASNVSISYHDWEMAAWRNDDRDSSYEVSAVDVERLHPGESISFAALGLDVVVDTYYQNCRAHQHGSDATTTELTEAPPSREPTDDRPGLIVTARGAAGQSARLLLYGEDSQPARCTLGEETYSFRLRRKRFPLPAVVHLLDFRKELHPGSQIAKSFSSRVTVEDEGVNRQVLISMNKPLRYKGYTFYQSSYRELPNGIEMSTLSVVKNYGRLLPYVATGVTVVGMVVHFLGMLVVRTRRRTDAKGVTA